MPEKPSVLVVGPVPPPVGGVETQITALLDSPLKERFRLIHCDTSKGRPKQTQGKFDLGNILWAWRHFRLLARDLKRYKPDVVYMPVSSTLSGFLRDSVFAQIINRHKTLLVGHVHGGDFDRLYHASPKFLRRYIVRTLNRTDVTCALGTMWQSLFHAVGVRAQVRIVPPTTHEEVFERGATINKPVGQPGDPTTILFVGQVGKRKGAFDILKAASRIHAEAPNSRLLMVGPDEFAGEWDQVMAEVDKQGLRDYIEFTGPLQGEDLLNAYARGDLLLLPSYHEGFPAVLIEAGAFGQPVITTPVGAITDYVQEGENGFLIPPGDPEAIADRVLALVNNSQMRKEMGEKNRIAAQGYHLLSVAAKVGDAIQTALDLPPNRRALGKRPRVLLVGPVPPPVGGVESVTRSLLDSDLRYDFDVVHCDISRRQTKENVSRITLLNMAWAAYYATRYGWQVIRHRPHIVHTPVVALPVPFARDAWFTIFAWIMRRRIVLHSHDGYLPEVYSRASPMRRRFMQWVYNRADTLVVISETWQRFFTVWGLECPIEVVYNPLDNRMLRMIQHGETPNGNPWTAVFVGAICRDKGAYDLLDAAQTVLQKRPDIRFRLIGPGRFPGEWDGVLREREKMGLTEKVEMPGAMSGQALADAYTSSNVFVLPTYKEGMPVVLLEAMAAGLPVITTDVGGIPDVIDEGVNGYLITPGDTDTLASKILEIAEHPERTTKMRHDNVEKVVANYLEPAVAERVAEVYRKVLKR